MKLIASLQHTLHTREPHNLNIKQINFYGDLICSAGSKYPLDVYKMLNYNGL